MNAATADVATLVARIQELHRENSYLRAIIIEREAKWDEASAVARRLLRERDQALNLMHQEPMAQPPARCAECGCVITEHGEALHCGHIVCYDCRLDGKAATHDCNAWYKARDPMATGRTPYCHDARPAGEWGR